MLCRHEKLFPLLASLLAACASSKTENPAQPRPSTPWAGAIVVAGYTASESTGTFSCTAVDPAIGTTKTVAGGKFYVSI